MNKFKSTKTYKSNKVFSCCFRQFKATSHCRFLHGYSLEINLEFEAKELDERNWVVDFGGLKDVEKQFTKTFDHKTLIDNNDPHIAWFKMGENLGILQLVILEDGVGCEMFALKIHKLAKDWLNNSEFANRCEITKVEVKEHDTKSAIYLP
ncbi:MAG: 6-carboxytetrahydropterin synthase [Bacteroidota bacterium]|nr:6-carboxytetrahydropterin synthase [Bacteroidota bacterium]